jgi:hypothetical protein
MITDDLREFIARGKAAQAATDALIAKARMTELSEREIKLIIEALAMAAARHEAQGHVTAGRFRRHHDDQAWAMRALRSRLKKLTAKRLLATLGAPQ